MSFPEVDLKEKAKEIRYHTCDAIATHGAGHLGGCMSCVELITVLYYKVLNVDPKNPQMEGRDRVVMSKGHAGPTLYATLALKGCFPMDWLKTLNAPNTNLPSHCDMNKTPGIDFTAGSLGQGFGCAVGLAKGSQIMKDGAYIYAILGDGESQEGSIWEAAMTASQQKLGNLIAFTDYNKAQIDDWVDNMVSLEPIMDKWESFGFNVFECDGHDMDAIYKTICLAKAKGKNNKPSMIILHTTKGKGVSFAEANQVGCHHMGIAGEMAAQMYSEVK